MNLRIDIGTVFVSLVFGCASTTALAKTVPMRFRRWVAVLLLGSCATTSALACTAAERADLAKAGYKKAEIETMCKSSTKASPAVPDKTFQDCELCPEMVIIPAGSFNMGSPSSEPFRNANEGPVHRVSVPRFAMSKTEVTREQWRAVIEFGGGWYLEATRMGVDYFDNCPTCPIEIPLLSAIEFYLHILGNITHKEYRLPSEAEWEYACRAGGNHTYCGGNDLHSVALTSAPGVLRSEAGPVGQKRANAFGLYDMSGNVTEWTADCWHENYIGAPTDGSAWTSPDCKGRVFRGGAWWVYQPAMARSAYRSYRTEAPGLRVVVPLAKPPP